CSSFPNMLKYFGDFGGGVNLKFFLQVLLLIDSIALIAIIILQPSKGEGLGAIGSGGQMFFAKNKGLEKLLDKATMWLGIMFGVLLVLSEIYEKFF
ncbi:MAG: preprotein translocase subunit SecG, partial [Bacteroidota bacterium]